MPYKGGVQLLPESERRPTLRSYTSGNKYFYIALVLSALILVASAILGSYKRSLSDQIDVVKASIVTGEKARDREQEKVLITASKQSKIMKQLLDTKLYWTQAFKRIEQMTQTSVKFLNIDAKLAKNSIAFIATADNFATVAKQLAAFSAASGVKDFTIGKIETLSTGGIKFSGEIFIDPKIMLMKATPSPKPKL